MNIAEAPDKLRRTKHQRLYGLLGWVSTYIEASMMTKIPSRSPKLNRLCDMTEWRKEEYSGVDQHDSL